MGAQGGRARGWGHRAGEGKTHLSELTSSLENRKLCSAEPACDFSIFSSISSCEETQARGQPGPGARETRGERSAWTTGRETRGERSAWTRGPENTGKKSAWTTGPRSPGAQPLPCGGQVRRPSSLSSRLLPGLPQAQLRCFTSCLHNSLGWRHSHIEGKPQNLGQGDPAAGKNVFQRGSALIGPNSPDPLFILDVRVLDRMSSRTDCVEGNEEVSCCNMCWGWG